MLSTGLKRCATPESLKRNYDQMVEYSNEPATDIHLVTTMTAWPDAQSCDLGWAYVSISGIDFAEAITVVVCEENGSPVIRDLDWGRP